MNAIWAVLGFTLVAGTGNLTAVALSETIPEWAKNTAIYWGEGEIDDAEFVNFLQFLIDRGLITTPNSALVDKLETDLADLKASIVADVKNAYQDGYEKGYADGRGNSVSDHNTMSVPMNNDGKESSSNLITVNTDKRFYNTGETVSIGGTTKGIHVGTLLTLIITSPSGDIVKIEQLQVESDGTFSSEHITGSALMRNSGEYAVTVTNGDDKTTSTFGFSGINMPTPIMPEPEPEPEIPTPTPAVSGNNHSEENHNDPIIVDTNKRLYNDGETVSINGMVRDLVDGASVSMIITSPHGDVVRIAKLQVESDGTFSSEHITGGPLMRSSGDYEINVNYRGNTYATATFGFNADNIPDPLPTTMSRSPNITHNTIRVEGVDDLITYEMIGGGVLEVIPVSNEKSLIFRIYALKDGTLTMTIPRTVFDSVERNGKDTTIFVLINDEEVFEGEGFEDAPTGTDRILTIEFPSGADEIEIIGTFVGSTK